MTDKEFFQADQEQWFESFKESNLPESFQGTCPHIEKSFLDIPQ